MLYKKQEKNNLWTNDHESATLMFTGNLDDLSILQHNRTICVRNDPLIMRGDDDTSPCIQNGTTQIFDNI